MVNHVFSIPKDIQKNILSIKNANTTLTLAFQAHQESVASLSLFEKEEWFIMSSAADSTFKIWAMNGTQRASMNINHPLPIKWDIQSDNRQKFKTQFLYAMKIMQQMNLADSNKAKHRQNQIDAWLNKLVQTINQKKEDTLLITQPEQRREKRSTDIEQKSVILLNDEYSPRDLRSKRMRLQPTFTKELAGTSLKTMNANKRIKDLQEEWRRQQMEHRVNEEVLQERERQRVLANEREN